MAKLIKNGKNHQKWVGFSKNGTFSINFRKFWPKTPAICLYRFSKITISRGTPWENWKNAVFFEKSINFDRKFMIFSDFYEIYEKSWFQSNSLIKLIKIRPISVCFLTILNDFLLAAQLKLIKNGKKVSKMSQKKMSIWPWILAKWGVLF